MSMMRLLGLPALFAAAIPLAQAQNVSFNATISGQVVPGVYGQVAIGNGPPRRTRASRFDPSTYSITR